MPEPTTTTTKPSKQSRGLPAGFGISAPGLTRKPVSLGDYLDDEPQPAPVQRVVEPEPEAVGEGGPVVEKPAAPKRRRGTPSLPAAAKSKHVRTGPPRKQINMRPETLDKARDILFLVQTYGPQPDAKASEVFEALVDLLHDARQHFDFSDVPLRGKWGDPSARAFPQHLKSAFANAIAQTRQQPTAKAA